MDIWLRIATNGPEVADQFFDKLEKRFELLAQWPMSGPGRPRIDPEARILVELPYIILYRLVPEGVQIVRIVHGARDINKALFVAGLE